VQFKSGKMRLSRLILLNLTSGTLREVNHIDKGGC
jgi:hypothetical protein